MISYWCLISLFLALSNYAIGDDVPCIPHCLCKASDGKGIKVFCSAASPPFTGIPSGLPNDTVALFLDSNEITDLPAYAFGSQLLPKLTQLTLLFNKMTSIDKDAFILKPASVLLANDSLSATPQLQQLDLSNNLLESVPNIPCSLMPDFKELILNQNKLTSFKISANFSYCLKLTAFSAENNDQVSQLAQDDLSPMLGKVRVTLGNGLHSIDPGALGDSKNRMSVLALSHNPLNFDAVSNLSKALNGSTSLGTLQLMYLGKDAGLDQGRLLLALQNAKLNSLTTLGISSNKIDKLDAQLPGIRTESFLNFEAESCAISQVNNTFFPQFPRLLKVLMNANALTAIPLLPNSVQNLDFSENPLGSLKDFSFSQLSDLRYLDLHSCGITKLNPNPDEFKLSKLKELFLQNNSIGQDSLIMPTLNQSLFENVPLLEKLDLSQNSIGSLDPDFVFKSLTKLTTLSLASQNAQNKYGLSQLSLHIFDSLSALQSLDLSGNAGLASFIPSDEVGTLFSKLSALQTLTIQNSILNKIPVKFFSGLSSLSFLDLSSNSFGAEAVANVTQSVNLGSLLKLDFSNNSIANLPTQTLASWIDSKSHLRELDLTGNPFLCDDAILDFYAWMRQVTNNFTASEYNDNNAFRLIGYKTFKCVGPAGPCVGKALYTLPGTLGECNTTASSTTSKTTGKDLSTGATSSLPGRGSPVGIIILIVVVSLIFLGGFLFGVFYYWRFMRNRRGYANIDPINI